MRTRKDMYADIFQAGEDILVTVRQSPYSVQVQETAPQKFPCSESFNPFMTEVAIIYTFFFYK